MDSYRAISVQYEGCVNGGQGEDVALGEDDIGHEPPPVDVGQNARRMQVCAYMHWTSLLGSRDFPRIQDLASAEKPDFAENAVVLDFSGGIENPAVTMLGKKLAEECGASTTIKYLRDVPARSLLSRITDYYLQISDNQAPIGFEAEFGNLRGSTVVYRGILLPFSSDGKKIQHIMGVIHWKELADPTTTAGLLRELDSAAWTAHASVGSPLGEWGDCPVAAEHTDPDDARLTTVGMPEWEFAQAASDSQGHSRAARYTAIGRS